MKLIGAVAGSAVQPAGTSRATIAWAAPFVPLVTETWIWRRTGPAPAPVGVGMTAVAVVVLTEKAGTTLSSIRFSPMNESAT